MVFKATKNVETSTSGSEFVALRIAFEMIQRLRYKLRMMGVPFDGPANAFCDNQAGVLNAMESTLKTKHVAMCYHRIREACAMEREMIRIAKDGTKPFQQYSGYYNQDFPRTKSFINVCADSI